MKKSYTYDVFISHAFTDKVALSDELNRRLREAGLKVWYSGTDMRVGQRLKESIIEGAILKSKFGVVIISDNLFKAEWARREVNFMDAQEPKRGYNMILPVWHKVSSEDIQPEFPHLIDCFAVNTTIGLEAVTQKLVEEIRKELPPPVHTPPTNTNGNGNENGDDNKHKKILATTAFTLAALMAIAYFVYFKPTGPDEAHVRKIIKDKILTFDSQIEAEYTKNQNQYKALYVEFDSIKSVYSKLTTNLLCKRNEYKLITFNNELKGRKKLEIAGFNTQAFYSSFGISQLAAYLAKKGQQQMAFMLINKDAVDFRITDISLINDFQATVAVQYINPLRYVNIEVICKKGQQSCLKQVVTCYGFTKENKYLFEKKGNTWSFSANIK